VLTFTTGADGVTAVATSMRGVNKGTKGVAKALIIRFHRPLSATELAAITSFCEAAEIAPAVTNVLNKSMIIINVRQTLIRVLIISILSLVDKDFFSFLQVQIVYKK
jgi:hypothetical protein